MMLVAGVGCATGGKRSADARRWERCAGALHDIGATGAAERARIVAEDHDASCAGAGPQECSELIVAERLRQLKRGGRLAVASVDPAPEECRELP